MTNERRKDIDYIRAIVQSGSFQAASSVLHVTQPAISQYVGRIEKELGVRILDREARPVRLTEEGRYYMQVEEKIEALRRQRQAYFNDINGLTTGTLTIGTNQCRTVTVLADTIQDFTAKYPGVQVSLREGRIRELGERMLRGETDFCLTIESLLTGQMDYRTILDEDILLAFPHGDALCAPARATLASDRPDLSILRERKFILLSRGLKFHDYFFDFCSRFGLEPRILLETESITTVLELVSKGLGLGFLPDSLVRSHRVEPRPEFLPLKAFVPVNRVVAAWSRERYLSKAARCFIAMLAERHRPYNSAWQEPAD